MIKLNEVIDLKGDIQCSMSFMYVYSLCTMYIFLRMAEFCCQAVLYELWSTQGWI